MALVLFHKFENKRLLLSLINGLHTTQVSLKHVWYIMNIAFHTCCQDFFLCFVLSFLFSQRPDVSV